MSLKRLIQKILDCNDLVRALSEFGITRIEGNDSYETHLVALPGKVSKEVMKEMNLLFRRKLENCIFNRPNHDNHWIKIFKYVNSPEDIRPFMELALLKRFEGEQEEDTDFYSTFYVVERPDGSRYVSTKNVNYV